MKRHYTFYSNVVKLDPDAQAFINAAALTDSKQIKAVGDLVTGLKSRGLWTKMKAIYPLVGGTATAHKFNLMNPLDADAAYRLVFPTASAPTHSALGMAFTGSNGQAVDTRLNANAVLARTSHHISAYVTVASNTGTQSDVTATLSGTNFLLFGNNSGKAYYENLNTTALNGPVTTSAGFIVGTRTATAVSTLYKADSQIGTSTNNAPTLPAATMQLGALTSSVNYNSKRTYGFFSIGDGLTAADVTNLYALVQSYQTTLGRQV